jgi:hypothetical protein
MPSGSRRGGWLAAGDAWGGLSVEGPGRFGGPTASGARRLRGPDGFGGPTASGARRLRGPGRFEARRLGAACRHGHAVLSPGVANALPHESGALMDRADRAPHPSVGQAGNGLTRGASGVAVHGVATGETVLPGLRCCGAPALRRSCGVRRATVLRRAARSCGVRRSVVDGQGRGRGGRGGPVASASGYGV